MIRLKKINFFVFFCVLVFVSGCVPSNNGPVTINQPSSNVVYDEPPKLEITYQKQPTLIRLNSADVKSFFDLGETSGTANTAEFASFLREGVNKLQVNPPFGPRVSFVYDSQGPTVVIKTVQGNGPIRVKGELVDPSGAESLVVNGISASVNASSEFDVMINPSSKYNFVARDKGGKSTTTTYAAPGQVFDRIITANVSQKALDDLAKDIEPIIQTVNTAPFLPKVNREIREALPITSATLATIEITDLKWSGIALDLDLKPDSQMGRIGFDANLTDINVKLSVRPKILFIPAPFTVPATAKLTFANATGDAKVFGENGRLAVNVDELSLDPSGVKVSIIGDYDSLILSAIADAVLPALKSVVSTFVDGIIEGVLDGELAEMGDEVVLDIGGRQLGITPLFKSFTSTDDNLHVVLGGVMEAKTSDPGVPKVLGSLYSSDPLSDAQAANFIYANVSSNLINQALMSAFQTGLTHFALINNSELLVGTQNRGEDKPSGTNRILITPSSPAFFAIDEVKGDPSVTFGLDGLKLDVQNKGGSGYGSLFTTEVDLTAKVVLGVNSDDTLKISFAGAPDVSLRNTKIFNKLTVNEQFIDRVIDLVMPIILPKIAEATRSIEIPRFAGYIIKVDDFAAVGSENSHLGVGLTLDKPLLPACPSGQERFGSYCYALCNEGYVSIGRQCWSAVSKQTYQKDPIR